MISKYIQETLHIFRKLDSLWYDLCHQKAMWTKWMLFIRLLSIRNRHRVIVNSITKQILLSLYCMVLRHWLKAITSLIFRIHFTFDVCVCALKKRYQSLLFLYSSTHVQIQKINTQNFTTLPMIQIRNRMNSFQILSGIRHWNIDRFSICIKPPSPLFIHIFNLSDDNIFEKWFHIQTAQKG